jgi:hypothetical protein
MERETRAGLASIAKMDNYWLASILAGALSPVLSLKSTLSMILVLQDRQFMLQVPCPTKYLTGQVRRLAHASGTN